MNRLRSEPMPVRYWSFAGLMLTQWCNASCASCYLGCSPQRSTEMSEIEALRLWGQLVEASPHGCRVHLTGGEPFRRWEMLLELCRRAQVDGLGPLEAVETNAYWATDASEVRSRITALDAAGMRTLAIAADPYHQQFVPIERVRLAARVAEDVLGSDRVRVRWRDWLETGRDTSSLSDADRRELFARYAGDGRDRMNGRAAEELADFLPKVPLAELADRPCRSALLRGKHVHAGPGGWIMPGTCAGIVLGVADEATSVSDCWRRLNDDHAGRPIVGALAEAGPVELIEMAREQGYRPEETYAGKCHLCWSIRRHLALSGCGGSELGPADLYEPAASAAGDAP